MPKMTAAVSPSFNTRAAQVKATRPPSFPSESASAVAAAAVHRRPKTRDVASRYLGTSSSSLSSSSSSSFKSSSSISSSPSFLAASAKRCQSPIIARRNRPSTPSASMRPPSTPRPDSLDPRGNGEVSTAQRMLLTSGRGLSASFQGDSFSGYATRSKLVSSPSTARRGSPERRKKTTSSGKSGNGGVKQEKSKLSEQWPRSRQPNSLSRSVDFTDKMNKSSGSGNGVARALQSSMINNKPASLGRTMTDSSSADLEKVDSSTVGSCSIISDAESVSSGNSNEKVKKLPARGLAITARFSQPINNRSPHQFEPDSPVVKSNGQRTMDSATHVVVPRKFTGDRNVLSPKAVVSTRSQLVSKREQIRPASPSKFSTPAASSCSRGTSIARGISPSRSMVSSRGVSPSRGMSPSGRTSPLRARTSLTNRLGSTPSILTFAVDAKKEKFKENAVADAHLLRLFHNRLLHWRFVNARSNALISAQKMIVEKSLYNTSLTISMLYDSVIAKRIEMQQLKQNLKLVSILSRQMTYLEDWIVVDRDYMGSLVGAAEALKGSTLCLPFDCGTMVNVQSVKSAICSAVDVMQAMASSICLLQPKVGKLSCLAEELARVNVKEQAMLDICRNLLYTISALQVTECSLKTQTLQLQNYPSR